MSFSPVVLLTDACCGLTNAQLLAHSVHVLPLNLHEGCLPSVDLKGTAKLLRSLSQQGTVLYIAASQSLCGGSVRVGMIAETEQLPVIMVDTRTIGAGLGQLVLLAAECLTKGKTADETAEILVSSRDEQLLCFVPGETAPLRRTRRVPALMPLAGKALYIDENGTIDLLAKGSSAIQSQDAMCEEIFRRYAGRPVRLAVFHTGMEAEAADLARRLNDAVQPVQLSCTPVDACLTEAVGNGLIGVSVLSVGVWD